MAKMARRAALWHPGVTVPSEPADISGSQSKSRNGHPMNELTAFATDLRALVASSGIGSIRALAKRAHYSRTTLAAAARGDRLPSLAVIRAFVAACDGDVGEWESRWRRLGEAHEATTAQPSPAVAASPWPPQPVVDGADPDDAGCSADAVTLHARRIAMTGRRRIVGQIDLRYSARTRAGWARFE